MEVPQIHDVVFVLEDTAMNQLFHPEIRTNYIQSLLDHFSGGSAKDVPWASIECSTTYTLVTYQSADALPNPLVGYEGPFTHSKQFLAAYDRVKFIGGAGEDHANGVDGLAMALVVFDRLETIRAHQTFRTKPLKYIIYISTSPAYDMPVMDVSGLMGLSLDDLVAKIRTRDIKLSIVAPTKLPFLLRLFKSTGGNVPMHMEKNYAKDRRHLILINGDILPEVPLTPLQSTLSNNTGLNPNVPGGITMQGGRMTALQQQLSRPLNPVATTPQIMNPMMANQQQQPQQQQQQMMGQVGQQQLQVQPQMPQQQQQINRTRETIWEGDLTWTENSKTDNQQKKTKHVVRCSVTSPKDPSTGQAKVKSDNWPRHLIMQLIPKSLAQTLGSQFFQNSSTVLFHPEHSDSLMALTRVLGSDYAGCVHFTGDSNNRCQQPNMIGGGMLSQGPNVVQQRQNFSGMMNHTQQRVMRPIGIGNVPQHQQAGLRQVLHQQQNQQPQFQQRGMIPQQMMMQQPQQQQQHQQQQLQQQIGSANDPMLRELLG
ncbi:hypothetical protein TCAL_02731 [Tigriopus californicus]|uniref:Mediator of RNA polymerase II transcription subunit 25 n=1 Tax=Tigriopus californicus TaxID=6832 RepID=A0A553NNU0_TIGCA|nr:hypothetical protein TCAL_02731 [Tigriopus californicus]